MKAWQSYNNHNIDADEKSACQVSCSMFDVRIYEVDGMLWSEGTLKSLKQTKFG
jgi:hypothetical protein